MTIYRPCDVTNDSCIDTGSGGGGGDNTKIVGISIVQPILSNKTTQLSVECTGWCGGDTGIRLEFRFAGINAANLTRIDFSVSDPVRTNATDPASGTVQTFQYTVKLPRTEKAELRIRRADFSYHYTGFLDLGRVGNGNAEFLPKPTATVTTRGTAPVVDSTRDDYFQSDHFVPDRDHWDQRPTNGTVEERQHFRWDLGPHGITTRSIYPEDEDVGSYALAPLQTHLTRGACLDYRVTADDTAGQLAEWSQYNASVDGAFYNTTTAPASYDVERVCVQNVEPTFLPPTVFEDPANPDGVVFFIPSVNDADAAAGFDTLVFELWDRDLKAVTDWKTKQATLVGTWDWKELEKDQILRVPLASFVDGASLCVMDKEKSAIVDGVAKANVDNMARPVCSYFPHSVFTTKSVPPVNSVKRLVVEAGPKSLPPVMTRSGAFVEERRVIAASATQPSVLLAGLTSLLSEVRNQEVGPDRVQQIVVQTVNAPSDATVNRLVTEITGLGVLFIVPAGTPGETSAGITPYWEIKGLAAHPDVLTVGAAREDGTSVRSGSSFGPSPLLRTKPDVTVRTSDSLDDAKAQLEATLYAADLALWYELRGVSDPHLVKSLVQRQALPVHGAGSLGIAAETGAGALDPARFSSNATLLSRTTLPLADLDAALPATGAAEITPLPVVAANALLDIGAVNHQIAKEGTIELVNPNALLRRAVETHTGDLSATLGADVNPYAASRTQPLVTVNVTFYSLLDLLERNFTHETIDRQTRERLADLANSSQLDGKPSPFTISEAEKEAVLTGLESYPDTLPRRYFVREVTRAIPNASYQPSCAPPSLLPIAHVGRAASLYIQIRNLGEQNTIQSALSKVEKLSWSDCAAAMTQVNAQVKVIQDRITTALGHAPGDAYLTDAKVRLEKERAGMSNIVNRSVDRARLTATYAVPLATEPEWTEDAPLGPYVGVVRVTTHDLCTMDAHDGTDKACADSSDYLLASMWLQGTAEFVLRDRAGRAMPGRPVTLQWLPPGAPNCSDQTAGAMASEGGALFASLFATVGEHFTFTDAESVARFPFVTPGYYDLHDGYVGFPVNVTYAPGSEPNESFGFAEMDCHRPVPIQLPLLANFSLAIARSALASCMVKTALAGLPVVSVQKALQARADGAMADPRCPQHASPTATQASEGLRAIQALRQTSDAIRQEPTERWQIVFPQVQQGRLVDHVLGTDVAAHQIGDASLGGWAFTKTNESVRADGGVKAATFGVLQYDYKLPPNEELAHFWTFDVDMANTEGIAIFTIRDDFQPVLEALAARKPASAAAALAMLPTIVPQAPPGCSGSCAPLAHYRFVPLQTYDSSFGVGGIPALGEDVLLQGAQVQASGFGVRDGVSRFFRFHTRECPADDAHVIFLFWQRAQPDLSLGVRFAVSDHRIWTWGGLGWSDANAPGPWALEKLPSSHDYREPYLMNTDVSVVRLAVETFEPKAESWDLFVDTINVTTSLYVPWLNASEREQLLVHPITNPATSTFSPAPDLVETIGGWLAEFEKSSYLSMGAAPAGESETQSYQSKSGSFRPDRRAHDLKDKYQSGRLEANWTQSLTCTYRETSRLDQKVLFGNDLDPARPRTLLQLLSPDALTPSPATGVSTSAWKHRTSCGIAAPPETYFHMLHVTRELAAAHPHRWNVMEHHAGSDSTPPEGGGWHPVTTLTAYPAVGGAWTPGSDSHTYLIGLDLRLDLAELLRDPTRLGLRGAAAFRDGVDVYGVSIEPGRLSLTATPSATPRAAQGYTRERDTILGVATRPGDPLRAVVEEPDPQDYIGSTSRRVEVAWDPSNPTSRPIIHTCDETICYSLRDLPTPSTDACAWLCPQDPLPIPPDGRWVILQGLQARPVTCGMQINAPTRVLVWHPYAKQYVALQPADTGNLLNPCVWNGGRIWAAEGESGTQRTCLSAATAPMKGASGGYVLVFPETGCKASYYLPVPATQVLTFRFSVQKTGDADACGRWEVSTLQQGSLGTTRLACSTPGAFVTSLLRLATVPSGTLMVKWLPEGTSSSLADGYLDRIETVG